MLGVRLTFHARAGGDCWRHADWILPAAEKAGLPVMFFAPGNMPQFAAIAERHPGLPLIIDHMSLTTEIAKEGKIARGHRRRWSRSPSIRTCRSRCRRRRTSRKEPYPLRDMTEHIKRCFDAFGPQRCYWGTDLTNSLAKATYRQRITHFTEELPFLSERRQGLGDGQGDPGAVEAGLSLHVQHSRIGAGDFMQVGFIGLGTMGARMAANLQKAGYKLVVHDLRKDAAAPHIAAGAVWAERRARSPSSPT